jgi:hypothetical protein
MKNRGHLLVYLTAEHSGSKREEGIDKPKKSLYSNAGLYFISMNDFQFYEFIGV